VLSLHPVNLNRADEDGGWRLPSARSDSGAALAADRHGSVAERAERAARADYMVGIQTEVSRSELGDILAEAARWRTRADILPPLL